MEVYAQILVCRLININVIFIFETGQGVVPPRGSVLENHLAIHLQGPSGEQADV